MRTSRMAIRRPRLRRSFLLALLLAGPTALAACSSSGGGSAGGSGGGDNTLTFSAFGGSPQQGFTKCVLTPFTKATGITVKYLAATTQVATAQVVAQKSNPPIDVMVAATQYEATAEKDGILAPLDMSKIPNVSKVDKAYLTGDKYGVPGFDGIAGIGYNTKVFQEHGWAPPTSWNDLFDPKYKGHVGLEDVSNNYMYELVYQLSEMNGGSANNYVPGITKLATIKPDLQAIYQADPQVDQAMENGSVWIAPRGGNRILALKEGGTPVDFVQPKEGVLPLTVSLTLIKNSPHTAAAYKLINFWLSPQAQDCMAPDTGYGPVESAALKTPGNAEIANYVVPENGVPLTPINWTYTENTLGTLTQAWDQQIATK